MLRGIASLACAALAAASCCIAKAESQLSLSPGITIRAERIDHDATGLKLYLPSMPKDALVVSPELAQIIGAQPGVGPSAKGNRLAIHGSNSVGAELIGAIIKAYASANDADIIEEKPTAEDERILNVFRRGDEKPAARVEVSGKGSATAFTDLVSGTADIGMSSRRINANELDSAKASSLGDLRQANTEFVLGRDGLSVIVNNANPISALTLDQIGKVFSGAVTDWSQLDPQHRVSGRIKVYARDESSGTWSTFNELVLAPAKLTLLAAQQFADNQKLVDAVDADPLAIGFVAAAYAKNTKALSIIGDCGMPSLPTPFNIKSEEYPLSLRLYLYSPAPAKSQLAGAILKFSKSTAAQSVVERTGFVNSDLAFEDFDRQAQRFAQLAFASPSSLKPAQKLIEDVRFAKRASITFHFDEGKSDVESSASQDDLARLTAELATPIFSDRRFLIVGFSSEKEAGKDGGEKLALERAGRIASELITRGAKNIYRDNVRGYGNTVPVSCSSERNQRVEIWLQN